jgi:hypothetical protein
VAAPWLLQIGREFMRSIFAILVIIGSLTVTTSAQTESELKKLFEGKSVTFRIDMPATSDGVNIYPEKAHSINYTEHHKRLKTHGATLLRGESARVTELRIGDGQIDVDFASTGFRIHFDRMETWMLTPATVVDALKRYVEFDESIKSSAQLQPANNKAAGFVRQGVVHLGPRTTYLKEGLKTEEVVKLLGSPVVVSEREENGKTVSTYEFQRGESRVLVAEFVSGALVSSRTVVKPAGSVAQNRVQ